MIMNNFFVAIFINDKVCQYKVDELIQNSLNGYINENFVFHKRNIYLPVQIHGNDYCLQIKGADWKCICDNHEITESKILKHGDYVVFSKDDFSYSVLFTEYQESSIACRAYELGKENVFIGRSDEMNVIIDINANVSRKCAAIRCDDKGKHHLEDLSGKTGIYLNDTRVSSCELCAGDRIYIMGTSMVYYPNMLIVPYSTRTRAMESVREFDVLSPQNNGYAPPQNNGYAPNTNYSNPSAGSGYRATSYGDPVDGSAPPKVSAVSKKDLSWLIYLTPVLIAVVYIVMYVFVLPRFVFNTTVGLLEWLFKNPDKILDALKDPSTFLNPIYLVIAIKVMGLLLVSGFITSLFWVGRTLHNKKPPISTNAMMVGNEAYISAMDIYEQMKLISSADVTRAKKAVHSICERLKNESDFGSGSSSVINCENEIASLLRSIEGNIPALYDKNSAEQATNNIEMLCQRILSKLKIRIELKKK
jgi:hypothetical protein